MNIFSYIKKHLSIFDVVNEYATLKKAGTYYKAHCPFHHEKTASFTVSPDKDIFYCFGCHVGGDVVSFMAKIENCSQLDAAKFLAERHRINLPHDLTLQYSEKHIEKKQQYHNICKIVAQWCHEQLLKNPSVLKYFKQRNLNQQSITYFDLGYFPGGLLAIKQLIQYMKTHNVLPHDLIEAHILAEGKASLYSPYEKRIIFPIKDSIGRCCGFGGRIFEPDDQRPKYYNSRENEYFTKGSLLFGLDQAKKSIQQNDLVFLVEGYTDCIAMVQHGYSNTLATLGTACTLSHLKQLARYASLLYIVYDSDTAGHQALMRFTDLCWQVNLELKVITLPAGEDPASFLLHGHDLQPLITQAKDIFLFFINAMGTNFVIKPLNQKVHITRTLLQTIQSIDDPLKRNILLQKAAKTFEIPFESLQEELKSIKSLASRQISNQSIDLINDDNSISKLEKKIFCAIMNNAQLFNGGNEQQLIDYLPSPLRDILQQLRQAKEEHTSLSFSQFFDSLEHKEKQYISKLLLEQSEKVDKSTFEQLLVQLQKKQWKLIVHEIKIKLTQAKQAGDTQKVSAILHDFTQLQNKIMPTITRSNTPLRKGD